MFLFLTAPSGTALCRYVESSGAAFTGTLLHLSTWLVASRDFKLIGTTASDGAPFSLYGNGDVDVHGTIRVPQALTFEVRPSAGRDTALPLVSSVSPTLPAVYGCLLYTSPSPRDS